MDYSKSIGIKEFLVYEDEGFSGGNIDRPQFKKMMQDAKDKKFDCLVCYRLDRISRNNEDYHGVLRPLFERKGIQHLHPYPSAFPTKGHLQLAWSFICLYHENTQYDDEKIIRC